MHDPEGIKLQSCVSDGVSALATLFVVCLQCVTALLPRLRLRRHKGRQLREFGCQCLTPRTTDNLFRGENGPRLLETADSLSIHCHGESLLLERLTQRRVGDPIGLSLLQRQRYGVFRDALETAKFNTSLGDELLQEFGGASEACAGHGM